MLRIYYRNAKRLCSPSYGIGYFIAVQGKTQSVMIKLSLLHHMLQFPRKILISYLMVLENVKLPMARELFRSGTGSIWFLDGQSTDERHCLVSLTNDTIEQYSP